MNRKGRALIVDDNEELRLLVSRILRKDGYEVVETGDGRRAVEVAAREHFDVVVSDVRMPDMGGVELLRALHELDPSLPVLLISGAPDLSTALQAVEYGAFEYLIKPVEPARLRECVGRAVASGREKRAAQSELDQFRSERVHAPLGAPLRESWTGELLGGRYRVGQLLGKGGMGAVYEAVREDLGSRRVAIKIVHEALRADHDLIARFRREAETIAALAHPNIVQILDFQDASDGPAFLVMELLEGMSLGRRIERAGCLSGGRVVYITAQVLSALAAAHALGVVHRDLKPDNVFLLSSEGVEDVVRVLDFGVVKLLEEDQEQKLTRAGAVLGTPAYMAPEQARGDDVDPRSDLYAVGCVMYEALAGRAPFVAANYHALLVAIQETEPPALDDLRPDLDPELAQVVRRAMARKPEDRYQSADQMIHALSAWLPASAVRALSETPVSREEARFLTTRPEGRKSRG